ncbi:hypothetical protein CAPTEDRAFT_228748 [Capitella teleta]|uniref:Major facilitator superfamily (MFS) profile domain-containing protein n=1 Tax=Capitella teleta TaxID=283909 RepID=R7V2H7_CAPTE|nr:hypothetical protein CAPTEDRAFT_228748 [Capitella teleta]|eukprot:ELU09911.1 hypothetical protein CAPTEDRAFT_228748 [Capitella teleta]
MDKCKNEADFTLGLIAYHDTPITDTLPGPAQLMFGRRINSRLGPLRSHSTLNTEQKTLLSEKRAAHLKQPTKQTSLATDQPVWVQHPITRKWHQGTVMRPDDSPHSWWVNEDNSDRLVRRNQHDIRPRRMASSAAERPSARTTVSPDVSNENLSPATSPDLNNQSDATTQSPSSSLPAPTGGILSTYFGHRWVILTGGLLTCLGMLLSAWAQSINHLCLTYGVLAGSGVALQYSPSVSVVGPYFNKRKPLALGLTMSGAALGPLISPMLFRYLIDHFTWRGALIIHAGIALQACIFAALMFPPHLFTSSPVRRPKLSRQDSTWKEITSIEVLKDPAFAIQFINNLMWCTGISPLWALLPDYAIDSGMTKPHSSMLISFASLGNWSGRSIIAVLMTYFPLANRLHVHCIATMLGGFLLAVYPLDTVFYSFAVNSVFLGLFWGILVGSLPVVTSELYGPKLLTNVFSYLMIADGLGFLAGPPISGAIYKASQSYCLPFIFNAVIYTLSGAFLYLVLVARRRKDIAMEIEVGADDLRIERSSKA